MRLFRNVQVVDVIHRRVFPGRVWVKDGLISEVEEEPGAAAGPAEGWDEIDGAGQYLAPGLLDAHTHMESSMVTPRRFAEAVVPSGTTCVVADPHEIANVQGEGGVRALLADSRDLPLRVFFSVPSCIPGTSPELETAAA